MIGGSGPEHDSPQLLRSCIHHSEVRCVVSCGGAPRHRLPSRQPTAIERRLAIAARALPPDSILARGLTFRSIGPAVMGGRIADIAVAENPASARGGRLGTVIYVGAATGRRLEVDQRRRVVDAGLRLRRHRRHRCGGRGAVELRHRLGRHRASRRTCAARRGAPASTSPTDGGKTWSGAMLPKSQHIGKIVVDPRDPNVVYVAAIGPLWAPGGERGLYKTTDGGKTWTNTKEISQYTGFTDIAIDPGQSRRALRGGRGARTARVRLPAGRARERALQDHRRRQDVDTRSPAGCPRARSVASA